MRPRASSRHRCQTIPVERLTLPGPDWVDERHGRLGPAHPACCARCRRMFDHGRLAGTGLPLDPPGGPGHRALGRRVLRAQPRYFDPAEDRRARGRGRLQRGRHRRSACSASSARRYAHRIPFLLKINHNEFLSLPERVRPDHVRHRCSRRASMGAWRWAPRSTSGSPESKRQIQEVSRRFAAGARAGHGHRALVLPAQRGLQRQGRRPDYHVAADLTGQANHLGVTIEADIIKQKLPETAAPGFLDLKFGKTDKRVYSELTTRPPDRHDPLPGRQLLHGPRPADQLGRRVAGDSDLREAVRRRSSTSAPAARASSRAARRSSGRARASSCSTRSRTSTSATRSRSPERARREGPARGPRRVGVETRQTGLCNTAIAPAASPSAARERILDAASAAFYGRGSGRSGSTSSSPRPGWRRRRSIATSAPRTTWSWRSCAGGTAAGATG